VKLVARRLILVLRKELVRLNGFVVNPARSLRKRATECERIPWRHLRNRNFAGYKFRRQHPIDPYTLDFYCPTAKLAIELDGGGHNYRGGQMRDQGERSSSRTKELQSSDFGIIKFAKNSTVCCKQYGLRSTSKPAEIPHLSPLPLSKGEANFTRMRRQSFRRLRLQLSNLI
jgi:very-short-patch-repair endonuclease